MSLLMDALKKAEQEKKAAVNRLEDSEEKKTPTDAAGADDTIVSKEITGEHKVPLEELGALTAKTTAPGDFTSTAELTLAPMEQLDEPHEQDDSEQAASSSIDTEDVTLNVTMSDLDLDPLPDLQESMGESEGDLPHDATVAENLSLGSETSFDETFHGVSLDEDDPELFQETMQGEAYVPEEGSNSYEETLPGVPALQFAKDIGAEDLPTPVAAQTVFTATNTVNKGSSGYKWLLVGLASLAIVAAGIWYYYTVTPMNRVLPSPHVAKGIENMVPEQIPLQLPEQILSGSVGVNASDTAVSDAMEPDDVNAGDPIADVSGLEQESMTQDVETVADEQTEEELVEAEPGIDVAQQGDSDIVRAEARRPDLPESVESLPAMFKISRSQPSGERNEMLTEAYQAYRQGDFDTAKVKYTDLLRTFPDNRDALLGMAAIALNQGDSNSAGVFYKQILKLNPQDDMAKAMLVNLQGKDLLSDISTMKSILHNKPEQPVVYFTLGNTYAKQQRWAEAQQAFFDAYRLDSANADYAFNLAISLDHINQRDAALDYYNVALKLAEDKPAGFDPATVMSRIQDLSAEN